MYKISKVSISGFWQKFSVESTFKDEVNIVIGKNGTGKTTFMNILYAVLAADIESLFENEFSAVVIKLSDGKKWKTIKAEKHESSELPFPIVSYKISTRKFSLPIFGGDDIRALPMSMRRRAAEEASKVKQELTRLVSLASLSVYRIGSDNDPDTRERASKRTLSPVDSRLASLMQRLTHYQLELSTKARDVASRLQRDVLISLLYEKDKAKEPSFTLSFDETAERNRLIAAYKQLGVSGADITKKIHDHTFAISNATSKFRESLKDSNIDSSIDFSPFEAWTRTSRVIALSLDAEKATNLIFQQIDKFLKILKVFIADKTFVFSSGDLQISGNGDITVSRLSSGEKQLLILFIEALLQRQQPYIFLADEPELSLHIAWQRNIIPAIREINPNAQIIVATHSPEVASKFMQSVIDMEDIRHV